MHYLLIINNMKMKMEYFKLDSRDIRRLNIDLTTFF